MIFNEDELNRIADQLVGKTAEIWDARTIREVARIGEVPFYLKGTVEQMTVSAHVGNIVARDEQDQPIYLTIKGCICWEGRYTLRADLNYESYMGSVGAVPVDIEWNQP